MKVLSEEITKITVLDEKTGEEIAVITEEEIITAGEHIVIKITPKYD